MAASDAIERVAITPADMESCLKLSAEAGWNQTADDWRIFIDNGRTIGVRSGEGELVASAAALPYDRFGFVSMVLVTPAWRRRGLATALVDDCGDHLRSLGLTPVLDATPAGATVYRQQGFEGQFELDRWQRESRAALPDDVADVAPARPEDLGLLVELDRVAVGADRPLLLGDFLNREGSRAFKTVSGSGFAMIRRGRRAMQVGPVVAGSTGEALRLLSAVLGAVTGAIFIDIHRAWKEVADWLQEQGFTLQRSFTRMAHGRAAPFGAPDRLVAAAGPEFG